jgi:heme exporter protein B
MKAFTAVLSRDLRLALRQGSDTIIVLAFFLIAVSLFPFGVGPAPERLSQIAAGVLWVSALLAALLSLDRLFQADYEDGTLDLLVTSPQPLVAIVAAKCLAQWLTTGLPLIALSPVLALLMQLKPAAYPVLLAGLALGTPVLTLIGAIGAALVLGARRGGVLVSLLVLPLYIPVLIFGVMAVDAALTATDPGPHLMLLAALLLGTLAIAPVAAAAGLRSAVE